ncbi:MAG: hypothetical protein QXV66_00730 [Candidatus Rehaiarchaeum fermentans]|nr:hypothetical protein [Candidatus Rehaiarchaeum fermentans]
MQSYFQKYIRVYALIALLALVLSLIIIFNYKLIKINQTAFYSNYHNSSINKSYSFLSTYLSKLSNYSVYSSNSNFIVFGCNLGINLTYLNFVFSQYNSLYEFNNSAYLNFINQEREMINYTVCKIFGSNCYLPFFNNSPFYSKSEMISQLTQYSSYLFNQINILSHDNLSELENLSNHDFWYLEVNTENNSLNTSLIPYYLYSFFFAKNIISLYKFYSNSTNSSSLLYNIYPEPYINNFLQPYFYYPILSLPFVQIEAFPVRYCGNYTINIISNDSLFKTYYVRPPSYFKVINISA